VLNRRLSQEKYTADQTIALFTPVARDVVDREQLESSLLDVVEETQQPEGVILLLKREGSG
jgi:hypothetical protein